MDLLHRYTELVFIHILCHIFRNRIGARDDPPVSRCQVRGIRLMKRHIVQIHQNETGCIPHLVGKITACLDAFIVIAHVIAGRIAGHECQTQCIRAVLINDLERIDAVPERLAHFASQRIPDQTMDQNCVER